MERNFLAEQLSVKSLGERIRKARVQAGLSQEQLSQKAGVAKRTIERLENGESIQLENFLNIIGVLGLLQNLDALVPNPELSPYAYVVHRNERPVRLRVRSPRKSDKPFKWGDEE